MPLISSQHLSDIELDLDKAGSLVPLLWRTAADTHVGRVRRQNEDAFFYTEDQGLWAVADGMGGHSRGELASKAVVDDIRSFTRFENLTESIKDLEARFLLANTACRTMFRREVVGSTVVALLVFGPLCVFLWAGDSRIYRLRNGRLEQVTQDHNLVQERCRRGEMTQEEAQKHPSANILTRAIGVHQNLQVDMEYATLEAGDRYLLCSDGLYRDLQFDEIEAMLGIDDPDEAVKQMVAKALDRGGRDNITGVIVQADSIEA